MKKGDFVVTKRDRKDGRAVPGTVLRVAKGGTWADIAWWGGWSKRMLTKHLLLCQTCQGFIVVEDDVIQTLPMEG